MITLEQIPILAIPSMNDTHLEESLIINKLDVAVNNNELDVIHEVLHELLAHTNMHYAAEEEMMEKAGFPDYKAHKKEHDRHLTELKSVINYFEINKEPRAIYAYIEGNLSAWTVHHANTMDRELALCVNKSDMIK
jgi:hemerythrin